MIKNLLFIILSWFEGLNFKSSSSLTLYCVEWVPEFISKACWKNRLVFLNLRILVFFSLKQGFVCCKFSFKRILDLHRLKCWEFCEPYQVISLQKQRYKKPSKILWNLKLAYQSPCYSDGVHVFQDVKDQCYCYQFYQHQILLIIYSNYLMWASPSHCLFFELVEKLFYTRIIDFDIQY